MSALTPKTDIGTVAVCKYDVIYEHMAEHVDLVPLNYSTYYDVMTTGATVSVCTRALLGAGAGAVDVLTLARVARPAF